MSQAMGNDEKKTTIGKRALGRVLAALNRADEIGGEVRDFVQEKLVHDPRYVAVRKRIAKARGETYVSKAEGDQKAQRRAEHVAAVAAPVAAAVPKTEKALGDAAIKAQIYGRKSCAWTGRSITIFERLKIDHDFIDLDEPEHEHFMLRLINETKQHTVPYVYLRGHFVGGYNALAEVERLGQLEVALMTAEERAAAPAHLRSVVIVPRPNTDEVAPGEVGGPAGAE
jgi:glutaredoxin